MDRETYRQMGEVEREQALEALLLPYREQAKVIASLLVEEARIQGQALVPEAVMIRFDPDEDEEARVEEVVAEGGRVLWDHNENPDAGEALDAWVRLGDQLDEQVGATLRDAQEHVGVICFEHDPDGRTGYALRLTI